MMHWRFGGTGWVTQSVSPSVIYKGVCRTAPATPGLLTIYLYSIASDHGHGSLFSYKVQYCATFYCCIIEITWQDI